MQNTATHQEQFIVSVGTAGAQEVDTSTMRAGIEHGINIARNEGMLTPLADESTEIGAIRVAAPVSPSAALLLMLESVIADTPAARRAVEMAVASIVRQHARDRVVILTDDEREHLITGVIETRKAWQSSGEDDWIGDVVQHGYDGYAAEPDIGLIENAFCDQPVFRHLPDDASRLAVLRILAKPAVLDVICSDERNQPVHDLEEFDQEVNRAVGPMTAAGRRSRPEDTLEALQLHGLILQQLQDRLGSQEADEEGDVAETPRG
ncbi:hypothetical protein [Massilia orientalis]|uniref:Uncharacterized protein n=1 Tax=Massilia orientalis TaxID=3050128 RepID=A0ACC7MF19_9BURK|nr:hypothetical protein [Massilia sp. YIM B02787]